MRRRPLPFVVLLAACVAAVAVVSVAPVPGRPPDAAAAAPTDRGPRPQRPPARQVADEVDLTTVVPALEEAFGDRYGGYWIEPGRSRDRMHVAVVDATPEDAAVVAELTGGHRRVVTDAVAFGYHELRAAQDEIARSLDRGAGNFTVSTDVVTNSVVVRTADQDPAAVAAPALSAAQRADAAPDAVPPPEVAPPPAPPASPEPAPDRDLAQAVVVERDPTIDLEPTADRWGWWAYESGLSVTTASHWGWYGCTSGFFFHHWYYGYFGSTAGHCGPIGASVAVGHSWIDVIRANRYDGVWWVEGDVALYSLTAGGLPAWPMIRANWPTGLDDKFLNSQVGHGLYLCFEGVGSDSDNCGTVVRSNEWLCCDGGGHAYFYSCINYPSAPGDSGGPVYHRYPSNASVAAGMVSSSVVLGGQRLMCFSMVESMQWATGMDVVTW